VNAWLSAGALIMLACAVAGCTEYTDDGDLVRHHFGYVKVISPPVHAPETAVRVLEVETYGAWVEVGSIQAGPGQSGTGAGLGYQHDRREFIPLDCRLIVRMTSRDQINQFLELWEAGNYGEEGICVIKDSS